MNIEIPVIPAGMVTLMAFFAPFAIAIINHPGWKAGSKRLVALVVSIALGFVALGFYYLLTGDTPPSWPWLILLAVVVTQAAYALLRKSVSDVEYRHGTR